jgi:hypothetical protein
LYFLFLNLLSSNSTHLLDLISHNCFPCSPEPHSCKIETTCFEFSHLGCTPHLWPLMVLPSLS